MGIGDFVALSGGCCYIYSLVCFYCLWVGACGVLVVLGAVTCSLLLGFAFGLITVGWFVGFVVGCCMCRVCLCMLVLGGCFTGVFVL